MSTPNAKRAKYVRPNTDDFHVVNGKLGAGANGSVYLCRDSAGVEFVTKLIFLDSDEADEEDQLTHNILRFVVDKSAEAAMQKQMIDEFEQEFKNVKGVMRINSDKPQTPIYNVVEEYEAMHDLSGEPFFARGYGLKLFMQGRYAHLYMEYINGITLSEFAWRLKLQSMKEQEVRYRRIFAQLVQALGSLKRKFYVHSDLHWGNIMITNEPNEARVIDLGLSFRLDLDWRGRATPFNSIATFLAPEYLKYVANAQNGVEQDPDYLEFLDKRDTYMMGCTFFYCLARAAYVPEETYNKFARFEPKYPLLQDFGSVLERLDCEKFYQAVLETYATHFQDHKTSAVLSKVSRDLWLFLRNMLQPDPSKRWNVESLMKHSWFGVKVINLVSSESENEEDEIEIEDDDDDDDEMNPKDEDNEMPNTGANSKKRKFMQRTGFPSEIGDPADSKMKIHPLEVVVFHNGAIWTYFNKNGTLNPPEDEAELLAAFESQFQPGTQFVFIDGTPYSRLHLLNLYRRNPYANHRVFAIDLEAPVEVAGYADTLRRRLNALKSKISAAIADDKAKNAIIWAMGYANAMETIFASHRNQFVAASAYFTSKQLDIVDDFLLDYIDAEDALNKVQKLCQTDLHRETAKLNELFGRKTLNSADVEAISEKISEMHQTSLFALDWIHRFEELLRARMLAVSV